MDLQSKIENLTSSSIVDDQIPHPTLRGDAGTNILRDEHHSEGVLTPVHYIVIVLMMYMGGIALLILKSVQVRR